MLGLNAVNISDSVQLIDYLSSTINLEHNLSGTQLQASTCIIRREMRYGARRSQARKHLYGILRVSQGVSFLPHDVMSCPIMTTTVRASLVVGAFADAGT